MVYINSSHNSEMYALAQVTGIVSQIIAHDLNGAYRIRCASLVNFKPFMNLKWR